MPLPKGKRAQKRNRGPEAPAASRSGVHNVLNLLRTNLALQITGAFLLVLALKWPVLHDPPVWDTAMSVFPAAITLEAYDFDLPRLLKEPSYQQAGPNVHADSLVTLITALIIGLTGETETFLPTLHLLHFLITALTLVAVYRYARPLLGETLSLLSALAILTFPLFLTQAGYMYLEMPLAFASLMAFLAWRNGSTYQAGLWATVSCWIKQTGILVGFALTVAAVLSPGRLRERLRRAAIVGFLPLSLSILRTLVVSLSKAQTPYTPSDAWDCFTLELSRYLIRVPDLAIFLGLFLLGCSVSYRRIWTGLRRTNQDDPNSEQNHCIALNCLAVLSFLLMIYVVAPLTLGECFGLPRYYVPVLPFVLTTLSFFVITLVGKKKTALLLIVVIGFFIINRDGIFYPDHTGERGLTGNNFAVAERSGAYRELARLQREAMHFLESLPPGIPIYFGRHETYLNRYPAMGYVKSTMTNARDLGIEDWDAQRIKDTLSNPPDCLYFLYNYPWLGGKRILYLVAKLEATHRSEGVRVFQSGKHKIILHRMRVPGSTCSGESP